MPGLRVSFSRRGRPRIVPGTTQVPAVRTAPAAASLTRAPDRAHAASHPRPAMCGWLWTYLVAAREIVRRLVRTPARADICLRGGGARSWCACAGAGARNRASERETDANAHRQIRSTWDVRGE